MECFGRGGSGYQKELHFTVKLLDETEINLVVQKNAKGDHLLEQVFEKLNLLETDYFGLRYLDSHDQTHWLDPMKPVSKQIRSGPFNIVYFGVKFYTENPCKLKEELTRYQFFLQIRMDMLQGRLPCSFHAAAELCAYATQSELGDYSSTHHSKGYISEFRFIPNQTEELEQQICELHKKLKGMTPSKAELCFLDRARWLDMYGVDLHPVLGENGGEFFLGLTPTGVVVYSSKTEVARYFWPRISKVYFKDSQFMLLVPSNDGFENELVFQLATRSANKHLWKCCVEQHAFFRLPQAGEDVQSLRKFSFSGSSFRHIGRTQREALEAASSLDRPEQKINRYSSRKYNRRQAQTDITLKGTPQEEGMFQDDHTPTGPNRTVLRRSPQAAHRLSTGRDSPNSAVSGRSVPWENVEQPRVGLFTPVGGSPVSVRSSTSRQYRHRGRSKSPGPHRHGDRSESESESALGSKRRTRRSNGSEGGSDHESRHHHQHRKRRSRSNGASSGSESEYGRSDEGRRRRRRSSRSRDRMVSSEQQWNSLGKNKRGEVREGQDVTVRRLRDGYLNDSSLYHYHNHHHHNHHHHGNHDHHHDSRWPPAEREGLMGSRSNPELQKHIKRELIDSSGLTEEELRNIPYTNVVTECTKSNGSRHRRLTRPRSMKLEGHSDSNMSEHSSRRQAGDLPPPATNYRHAEPEMPRPTGDIPRPSRTSNGPTQGRYPDPTPNESQWERRVDDIGVTDVRLIQSGGPVDEPDYIQTGRGLYSHQEGRVQNRCHPHGISSASVGYHQDSNNKQQQQEHQQHQHQHQQRLGQALHRHPQPVQGPTLGMEGLQITHSREDSGLGNDQEDGLQERKFQLPRQNGHAPTATQTLRRELDAYRSRSDPMPSGGDISDLRSALHLPTADPRQVELSGSRNNEVRNNGRHGGRGTDRGSEQTPKPQQTPSHWKTSTAKTGNPTMPGRSPNWGLILRECGDQSADNNNSLDADQLWTKPLEPQRSFVTSPLVDDRDIRSNGDVVTARNSKELADYPPGYKPDYKRGAQRDSITTQEILRVSQSEGDHRDVTTEL